MVWYSSGKVKEPRRLPLSGGFTLQRYERRAIRWMLHMRIYSNFVCLSLLLLVCAIRSLRITKRNSRHYCNRGGWSHKRLAVSFRQAVCLWLSYFYYSISFICIQDVLLCFIFEILNFAIFISPFYLNQQIASHPFHDSETIRRSG